MLHISKEGQRERLQARLDEPESRWKFDAADLEDRKLWDEYETVCELMFHRCSTEWAPWHVIPADRKWFTRLVVSAAIIDAIQSLDPRFPEVDPAVRAEFKKVKEQLEAEDRGKTPARKAKKK